MTAGDALLASAVRSAYESSSLVRRNLDAVGVGPAAIRGRDDLQLVPFMTKECIREAPLEAWAMCRPDVVRVHASSGTTGRRTLCGYTAHDLQDWAEMVARCFRWSGVGASDRVQISVGFGLSAAGEGFQAGVDGVGALALPTGPGDSALQLAFLRDLGSTVLCATSSFAVLLAERHAETSSAGLVLRVGLVGSERLSPPARERVERLLAIDVYDVYGATELWGPGAGVECSRHDGIHLWSDYFVTEVVDPETLLPAEPGVVGELVVTTLTKQASPLVRFRTRDLAALHTEPCPCGSPYPRISSILGRTDDLVTVRGVGFYPAQVEQALAAVDPQVREYQVYVRPEGDGGVDVLVKVEAAPNPAVVGRFADELRRTIGLRMRVEVVSPAGLPRSEHKARRVFDERPA